MKILLTLLTVAGILLGISHAPAQVTPSANTNYVVEQTPRTSLTAVSFSSLYPDVPATISYFDGLGRPLQTVLVRGSGNAGSDLVSGAITYDAYGRPKNTYLPLPGTSNAGQLNTTVQAQAATFYADQNPYAETIYEASPLARPTQQFGPGQAWRVNSGKPQIVQYGIGTNVLRFTFNLIAVYQDSPQTYGANDITTRTVTDERGNQTVEYTDLEGHVIRRDVVVGTNDVLTTVYIYDGFGRLGAVIPPKLYRWFVQNPGQALYYRQGTTPDERRYTGAVNPLFKETAYVYLYNKRGLVSSKHVPGAGWSDMIYDRQDRLVLSHDQQDKTDGKWRFTRYDIFGRPVMTGRTLLAVDGEVAIGNLQASFYEQNPTDEDRGNDLLGYTNRSFPATVSIAEDDILTVNYYDTALSSTNFTYENTNTFGTRWLNTTGQLTGTKIRNLETTARYENRVWYDFKGRVIQSQSQNHLGGNDRVDTDYRFNGEVLQMVMRHQKGAGGPVTTVATSYTYDHIGRPTQVNHAIDTATPTVLATSAYDAIGRMQTKTLGGGGSNAGAGSVQTGFWNQGSTWQGGSVPGIMSSVSINTGHTVTIPANNTVGAGMLYDASRLIFETGSVLRLNGGSGGGSMAAFPQTIDYSWHIRGGLRGLNLNASDTPDLTGGKSFAMKLGYEDAGYFDGNIGSQTWLNGSQPSQTRSYTYTYDNADRLTTANYGGDTYTVNGITYDANGNIQSMNRNGVDQLAYRYDDVNVSNKLLAVTDNNTSTSSTVGFADGTNTGDDYDYWLDGSLKKDLNRGITDIQYNLLKLPRQLTFSSGKVVQYQYDASGSKLKMSVTGTGSETRDYVGAFQYLNNTLFEIAHEEGRYSPTGGYEYFHKDHLGNVRVAFNASGITQYTDYDPWGLPLWGGLSGGNSTNRDQYNGKESLSELGAGVSDYGARLYDATIGRWGVVDPMAEVSRRFSPFVYGNNNPLRFIDPDGMNGIEPKPDFNYSYGYGNESINNSSSVGFRDATGTFGEPSAGPGPRRPATTATQPSISSPQSSQASMAPAALGTAGVIEGMSATTLETILARMGTGLARASIFVALMTALEGDRSKPLDREDINPKRIAFGVDEQLKAFSTSPNVRALPYTSGWAEASDSWEVLSAIIVKMGMEPNTTFHFNLSTPRGLVNDPINMNSNANKYTTREYQLISTMFPHKTTFYIKSGTIYKPLKP